MNPMRRLADRKTEFEGPIMSRTTSRLAALAVGLGWTLMACYTAQAQDIEIFLGNSNPANGAKPNILLVLDDSISMGSTVNTQVSYDPARTYSGSCSATRVYWSTGGRPPGCSTTQYVEMSAFYCKRALDAFAAVNGGTYQDYFAQYDNGTQKRWETLSSSYHTLPIECQDDLPDASIGWAGHGDGSSATAVYPRNGNTAQLWSNSAAQQIAWGATPVDQIYNVFSGNYLNFYYGPTSSTTRLQVMQDVATNLINSVNGVNVGLMHFRADEGGVVSQAMQDVSTSRSTMETAINSLTASNFTPLEETLYEAYNYLSGSKAVFGGSSGSGSGSVSAAFASPASDEIYNSPIDYSCQKNHIVILTDGEPRNDSSASSSIKTLTDAAGNSFASVLGQATPSCDVETYPAGFSPSGGDCLDDLAEFMNKGDISPLPGIQNVTTHTIGFLVDLPNLQQTAERGGGEYYTATDTASLQTALTNIVTSILDTQATFTAPSISINAFNQTRHLNDIYVGVFRPSGTTHWPGNLKKFRLRSADSTIVDANDLPILDPVTGGFADTVQDFWSSNIDGPTVALGGAANQVPAGRNVYSYFGNADLTSATNAISTLNTNLTDAVLGTGLAGDPTLTQVVNFINGYDASDIDGDTIVNEARHQLGDPLHSRPVVVVYGPDNDDALVFMGTNDGYLHAFDVATGREAWSFLPPEFLDDQVRLFVDNASSGKIYGPDGGIRVQTIADSDGVIDAAAGEKVYLFFGMRRGGDVYYALDVTNPAVPKVLWRKDSASLPGMGQSWASVTPTRINVSGATQNANKLALVIAGGYDPSQDGYTASTDTNGNSIYIVDTVSGALLWRGTNSGGTQNFSTANWSMDYSMPSDVKVIDLNGDGFGDRMYAADMGGQVWRFDITNGNPASSLVTGGVIAQLGAAGLATPTDADTRRFYYAPDVARVVNQNYNFMHIGIGSGYRAHPNSTVNHDEFYALRDYWTYTPRTQAQYDALVPTVPSDLVDVTTDLTANVPQGSAGWRMSLNDGGWQGEKVLAEARTFAGEVFISTYRPGTSGVSCEPALGTTRQYIVNLFNARPVTNLDGSAEDYNGDGTVDPTDLQLTDRYREFEGPPPPETVFFFPGPEGDVNGDGVIDAADQQFTLACMANGNCLGETPCQGLRCFDNGVVRYPTRTFWTQSTE
jgi:type IV pilus assembly protein PilY1